MGDAKKDQSLPLPLVWRNTSLHSRREQDGSKRCSRCKEIYPLHEFTKNKLRADGLAYHCSTCRKFFARRSRAKKPEHYREYDRKWKNRNRATDKWKEAFKKNTEGRTFYTLKWRHGVTREQYLNLLDKQGGGCAICGRIGPNQKRLFVDHCHETGKIRGLLCRKCNAALGFFDDDPSFINQAYNYLMYGKAHPFDTIS